MNDIDLSKAILIDPTKLKGLFVTGQSSKVEYKKQIQSLKESLDDIDYVFASINQVYKKGVIDNPFPTLAVGFDENIVNSIQEYHKYVEEVLIRISKVMQQCDLPINVVVLDRRDSFLNNFKKPISWLINVKNKDLLMTKKPWWKV